MNAYYELEIYWTARTGWREGRTFWNVLVSSELEAFFVVKDSWRVQSSLETAFCKATFQWLRGLCLASVLRESGVVEEVMRIFLEGRAMMTYHHQTAMHTCGVTEMQQRIHLKVM